MLSGLLDVLQKKDFLKGGFEMYVCCVIFDWPFMIVCIYRCDSLVAPQTWNERGRTLAIEWVDYPSFLYDEVFETYFQVLWYIQCIFIDCSHSVAQCPNLYLLSV